MNTATDSLVHGEHDGKGVGEVRGYVNQVGSLMQCLLHHPELRREEGGSKAIAVQSVLMQASLKAALL